MQVVIIDKTNVGNVHTGAHHHCPLEAPAKSKTAVNLGVDAAGSQHIRMHHAGAAQLQPAGFADAAINAVNLAGSVAEAARNIDFKTRFGEFKVMRAQTRNALGAEISLGKMIERAAQVRKIYSFVDHQSLELMEHDQMRDVRLAAVGLAKGDHADGRAAALHFVALGV